MKLYSPSGLKKKAKQMIQKTGNLPVEIYCLANKMSHGSFLCLQFTLQYQFLNGYIEITILLDATLPGGKKHCLLKVNNS